MKTIHKQVLEITDKQTIKIPYMSIILSVGNQREDLCLWYCCDTRNGLEQAEIFIFGTGHEIPKDFDGKFLGTVLMANGMLVWHVFRKI